MKFAYYPGCSIKAEGDSDRFARRAAEKLGVELVEIPEWQCCGGVYPLASDEIASRLGAVRALEWAKRMGLELVTLCSACLNVLKRVNEDMRTDEGFASVVNTYCEFETPYRGETNVFHYLEVLRDRVGFEEVRKAVLYPLRESVASYYGCLLLRPGKTMQIDKPEDPTIMEDLMSALGAKNVYSPYRVECCGGYVKLNDASFAHKKCADILASMRERGATIVTTTCPLCKHNLLANMEHNEMQVVLFTDLLAKALGAI